LSQLLASLIDVEYSVSVSGPILKERVGFPKDALPIIAPYQVIYIDDTSTANRFDSIFLCIVQIMAIKSD
jgi:hypothetical protein